MNSNLKPLSYSDEVVQHIDIMGGKDTNFTPLVVPNTTAPEKCVIGTETYRAWFSQLSSSLPVTMTEENTQALKSHCRDLREQLRKMPMPKAIDLNLRQELFALCQHGPVSVRSSATLDDGQSLTSTATKNSFSSVVGVDAVIARVIDCFVSMWDDKAVKIWSERGVNPADVSMIVVVK